MIFERYTDQARRVVATAEAQARTLNHDHDCTPHILLGLIHERESLPVSALESLGISQEKVRGYVVRNSAGGPVFPRRRRLPFTPAARRVLEQSRHWALRLGDNYIGAEHILLALSEEGESRAAKVLAQMGADPRSIRRQVMLGLHAEHNQTSD